MNGTIEVPPRKHAHIKPARTKWRAGACENCGAMGHKRTDCLEKPRKLGARWTGRDIASDDAALKDLSGLGYEAKRDRWNGYDAERDFMKVHENFERVQQLQEQATDADEDGTEEGDLADGEIPGDDDAATKGKRNLRIREDTAKYLVNLDLESAKYDPKTRSMVGGDPVPDADTGIAADDGFVQSKELDGEAAEFAAAQRYAWEVEERAKNASAAPDADDAAERIHLQANPTAGALAVKREAAEREQRAAKRRQDLIAKYGEQATYAAENAAALPLPASSDYVEYDERGREVRRNGIDVKALEAARPRAKSKYPEDVFINNHTSVFGSWWSRGEWGYQWLLLDDAEFVLSGRAWEKGVFGVDGGGAIGEGSEEGA